MPTIDLNLPEPHPAQRQIISEAKRFNAVVCGRRWGKTVLAMDRIIKPALQGWTTAWFAPNYKYLADAWRELLSILKPAMVDKNETEHRILLVGGGSIECWSLDSPDAGRGRKYKAVVVDEAAMVKDLEQAWSMAIRPTLTDCRGDAWLLSTPRGISSFFHKLYLRGQDAEDENWASWQQPTSENPFIDPAEIEAAKKDMSELAHNQEYLAAWCSWEGSVFRSLDKAVEDIPEELTRAQPPSIFDWWRPVFCIGADWARSGDYSVFMVLCDEPLQWNEANLKEPPKARARVVYLDRFRGVEYALQRSRLRALWERFGRCCVLAEANSIGGPVLEELRREGVPVRGFQTTNATKGRIIDALALAFEQETLKIPDNKVLIGELQSFESRTLPSGLVQYSAPEGGHDDCVMSLAIALEGLKHYAGAYSSDPRRIQMQQQFAAKVLTGGFCEWRTDRRIG